MIRVLANITTVLLPLTFVIAPLWAQQAATESVAPAAVAKSIPPFLSESEFNRLSSLNPADPNGYLELGEELLDSPDSPERVALTRELLVRALEYGRIGSEHRRVAASAAIALASMSKQEGDRLWLRSVAAILEPSSADLAPSRRAREQESQVAAARASLFLTQLRAGAGIEARDSLAAKGVRQILEAHERELSASGTISVQDLEIESRKWPCTDCAGTGIIAPPKGQRGPAKICPVCDGQPGLKLRVPDFGAQLRLQRRLTSSFSESWGSVIATQGASPARDPDPANVAPAFAIDVRLTVWRDGNWTTPTPEAPSKP
ncbi:MAG: hypothetical protein KF805_10855 [Phycisphaeraceae bacterium]|nr:hypothetical protein [Phycisphaeraceae bacterium]